jgi:hypothetical protein
MLMSYPELMRTGVAGGFCIDLQKVVQRCWCVVDAQPLILGWAALIRAEFDRDNLPVVTRTDEFPNSAPLVDLLTAHVVETLSENYKVGVSVCVFGVIFPHTWGTRNEVLGPLAVTF